MSEEKRLAQARQLIQQKEFAKAYKILQEMPTNPTAVSWMGKLQAMGVTPPVKQVRRMQGRRLYWIGGGCLVVCFISALCVIFAPSAEELSATETIESGTAEAARNQTATIIAMTPSNTPTVTSTATSTAPPTDTPPPTITLESTSTAISPASGMRYISAINLNVRSGPGGEFEVLGTLEQNDTVQLTGESNGWYRIEYNEGDGWIASQFTSATRVVPTPTELPTSTREPFVQPTSAPVVPAAPCSCSGDIYNCSGNTPPGGAQACYDYCKQLTGRDVHNLDGNDNDGLVCEG